MIFYEHNPEIIKIQRIFINNFISFRVYSSGSSKVVCVLIYFTCSTAGILLDFIVDVSELNLAS